MPDNERKAGGRTRQQMPGAPGLPDVKSGGYLRDIFNALNTGELIRWSEISGYIHAMGVDLRQWEVTTIRSMSAAYLDGQRRGKNPLSIPPFDSP